MGKRARVDEGAWARAMVYMADDNGKQPERASDDWGARRLSSKINEIGVTTPQYTYLFFDVVACAHSHPKKSGSRVTQLKIADASKPNQKLVPVCIRGVPV